MKKIPLTGLAVGLILSAAAVEWEFPRTGSCHEGLPFADGRTGVLVWGGGETVNVTLGRGDLWDHRGGYAWTAEQSYTNIVRLAQAADEAGLKALFRKDVPPGEPRNPLILPLGRIVITVPGAEIRHGSLDPKTGLGRLDFTRTDGGSFAVGLAMSRLGFAMKFPDGVAFTPSARPSMDNAAFGAKLKAIGHRDPEKWANADGSAGGFFWRLVNPSDAPVSVAWGKRGGELTIATARGEKRATADGGYEAIRAESLGHWAKFWRKGACVTVPDPEIQEIFDYGMYRFGAMTDPAGYPCGLQGQWLEDDRFIPWSGDYHFNINVQECYAPAYRGGHFGHLKPLWKMILSWKPLLRENARKFVHIDNGYVLPHSVSDKGVNIGGFWTGTIDHASAAWMASLMFRYVKYSGDVAFLKADAYDFMKGTMNVYLAMMEEYKGRLSLPIAPSPEWKGDNVRLAVGRDPSFQLAAAHRLAIDLIDAAKLLGETPDPRWTDLRQRLPLYTVYRRGPKDGGIAIFEGTGLSESHRHHSHMAGIYPFATIPHTGRDAVAIQRTYDGWIAQGTGLWSGWCVPWASILHTDAGNAVAAVQMLKNWKAYFNNPGHGSLHDAWNRGFSQLVMSPQIMQMDGQCAAVAAILEMMVHEIDGKPEFFRGCPESWKDVSFENIALADGRRVSARRVNGKVLFTHWLDEVDLAAAVNPRPKAWRKGPRARQSAACNPLVIGDVPYARGVGMGCESIHLDLDRAERFDAVLGIDSASGIKQRHRPEKQGRGWIRLFLDGEEVYDTGLLVRTSAPQRVSLDLRGHRRFVIECFGGDFRSGYDAFQPDIGEGRFSVAAGGSVKAIAADDPSVEEWGTLTPPESESPRINGAKVFGVRPGHPILYRLPVTGVQPFEVTAAGLPEGAVFDAKTRMLTGAVAKKGTYPIEFTVRNAKGQAKRTLKLVVGDRICLTPALGWNSWNCFMRAISAKKALTQADAFVSSGLIEHGWSYICLDAHWNRTDDPKWIAQHPDEWAPPTRNADGTIRPNGFFPDMKGYVDYIHSKGLKAGIYSSPSFVDCGHCAAVGTNIAANARQFADWGFDYLKYDCCGAGSVTKHFGREQAAGRFTPPAGFDMDRNGDAALFVMMGEALRRVPRDIVYAISQTPSGIETWGEAAGAASWRTDGDLTDIWTRVLGVAERSAQKMKLNRPGFVADLDMLSIGFTRSGVTTFLTPNQQYSHLSIWAITASTMMIGGDTAKMDDFTRALLSNDEVLAVSQDELGAVPELKVADHGVQIWTRRLADGSFAALAVNKRPFRRRVRLDFAALGLPKSAMVRDLWRQRTLGDRLSAYEADLPPFAPLFVQIDASNCNCD